MTMEEVVGSLTRQYLQLVEPTALSLPTPPLLLDPRFQTILYAVLFEPSAHQHPPPARYTFRVLKHLIALFSQSKQSKTVTPPPSKRPRLSLPPRGTLGGAEGVGDIKSSSNDNDQVLTHSKHQEIDSDILNLYTYLLSTPSSSSPAPNSLLEKANVTYTLPPSPFSGRQIGAPITLFENRNIISGQGTTGLRTWEAALALSEYLILSHFSQFYKIAGIDEDMEKVIFPKDSILELGAGTGMLSILAARLGVRRVCATDGDEGVCRVLKRNIEVNGVADEVCVKRRLWGQDDQDIEMGMGMEEEEKFDLVLGADLTYDTSITPHLTTELSNLLDKNPKARIIISATIRNQETYTYFINSCSEKGLTVLEKTWTAPTPRIFWYSLAAPIRIVFISRK